MHIAVVRCFAILLLVFGLLVAGSAWADDGVLYQGTVPINNASAGERAGAVQRALLQVIGKLTGQRNPASLPQVRGLLGGAAGMVVESHVTTDQETINGAPIYRQRMIVRFDRNAVDGLIAGSGLPSWPGPRAPVVLWLVIDDGHGPRLVGSAHVNVVKSLTDRGNERGIGFVLPAGSVMESQVALLASGIGPAQAVVLPSANYGPIQLIGRLTRTAGGWRAQWILLDGGIELARWGETNGDARLAMADGADAAADALAKKYAKVVVASPPGTFTVDIDGIRSGDDYVRAMGYLQGIGIVRRIVLLGVTNDRLHMQLDLATGVEGLRNVVAVGQVLAADPDPAATVFHLRP
ncbi:MAG: DUF2066 domain-containing protein [Proteobacteria bacterium]|nr:DUF2066 domain-containing protein [Pseudomonadota bacterium]